MSFYKQYPNRKDWRKQSFKRSRLSKSCQNHGSCGVCQGNRFHSMVKRELSAESTKE